MKRLIWLCMLIFTFGAIGCSDNGGTAPGDVRSGSGYGEDCDAPLDCREGLTCIDGQCLPDAILAEGEPCELDGQCEEGLKCDPDQRQCVPAGDSGDDNQCGSTLECERGLVCVPVGFTGQCQPAGETDIGGSCDSPADCLPGLNCNPDPQGDGSTCQAQPRVIPDLFQGVQCEPNDEDGAKAYFELPNDDNEEFYRLPFPNDIRIENGSPDMSGHVTPGPGVLDFDIVQRYLNAISEHQDRYGLGQSVYFRFSNEIDFGSVTGSGESPTLLFKNIDADSPDYDRTRGMSWQFSNGRQQYVCQNWLAVRPRDSNPLHRETTYAVILTTDIKDADGNPVERDADFEAMLQDSEPSDAGLAEAWRRYQPLRDWIAEEGPDKSTILSAAVFTTGDPWAISSQLRDAARETTPELSDAILCEEGTTSPCDDGLEGEERERGCFDVHPDFYEIQGRINLPNFQTGEAPYIEDGDIATNAGAPVKQREESVCTAITVPKMDMPEDGWPLLLYAHGTGGSFRNHVTRVSPTISKMNVDGTDTGMLVMGWDQILHFDRRGDSDAHPNELVFNYPNPLAARANFLQGAADIHAVVAWAENFNMSAADSPHRRRDSHQPGQDLLLGTLSGRHDRTARASVRLVDKCGRALRGWRRPATFAQAEDQPCQRPPGIHGRGPGLPVATGPRRRRRQPPDLELAFRLLPTGRAAQLREIYQRPTGRGRDLPRPRFSSLRKERHVHTTARHRNAVVYDAHSVHRPRRFSPGRYRRDSAPGQRQ